jgi:uncharacterized protein YkwD
MRSMFSAIARPRPSRLPLLVALLTVLAAALATAPRPAGATAVALESGETEQAMIGLINRERETAGLSGLSIASGLRDVAVLRAQDMAAGDYLSHYNREGIGAEWLLDQHGVARSMTGENIGRTTEPSGYPAMEVVKLLHDAFMRSANHRDNVLDQRFNQVGVGMASANGKFYVAIVFTD